jgi:hypothetical protein
MPYREADAEALVRAEPEIRAREELAYRAAVGRQARSLARVLSRGGARFEPTDAHLGLTPYRNDPAPRAFAWTLGAAAGIAGYMTAIEWLAGRVASYGPPALVAGLSLLLVGQRIGLWAGPRLMRLAAIPWLRRLPFPLHGYLALHLIRRAPATISLRVVLDAPDDAVADLLADLVWQVDESTAVSRDGDTLVLRTPGESRAPKPMPTWAREIVDDVLVPVHAIHPIRSVAVAIQR